MTFSALREFVQYLLKATEMEVGLLLNCGRNSDVRRRIYTNDRKKIEED